MNAASRDRLYITAQLGLFGSKRGYYHTNICYRSSFLATTRSCPLPSNVKVHGESVIRPMVLMLQAWRFIHLPFMSDTTDSHFSPTDLRSRFHRTLHSWNHY